jgi:OmpA-OmpF porin, OOP family
MQVGHKAWLDWRCGAGSGWRERFGARQPGGGRAIPFMGDATVAFRRNNGGMTLRFNVSAVLIPYLRAGLCAALLASLGGALLAVPLRAHAQSAAAAALPPAPTASEMVEQLRSAPPTRGLTRSSRNLVVEAADGASAPAANERPAAAPSLSLLIQFDFNSDRISADSRKVLGDLATALQSAALRGSKFAVEGHTDGVGQAAYNQRLSESRAAAVRTFLMASGVEGERLRALGKGAGELAKPDDPKAAENRRVRIVNLD